MRQNRLNLERPGFAIKAMIRMRWVKTTREATLMLIPFVMIIFSLTIWLYVMFFVEKTSGHVCNNQGVCVNAETYFSLLSEGKDFMSPNIKISFDDENDQ